MSPSTRQTLMAFFSGGLFAGGLALAGMTMPSKVIAFLDVAGDWDPSLAFVMGGAILVYMPLYRLVTGRRVAPVFAEVFSLPTRQDIDTPLLVGAAMFGVGWGLGGFCPGPGLASVTSSFEALTFVLAMTVGMGLVRAYRALASRRATARVTHDRPSPTDLPEGSTP